MHHHWLTPCGDRLDGSGSFNLLDGKTPDAWIEQHSGQTYKCNFFNI
jgi:hypothetical protein